MSQLDPWKQIAHQQGVGGIRKLLAQYRIDLAVPEAPPAFTIKLYEKQDGRFEAIPSYTLSFEAPRTRTAQPARPGAKPPSAKEFDAVAWERSGYASEQEALSQTVQMLVLMSRLSRHATWEANPAF